VLLDFIQSLYAYNTWANQRVLETATPISTTHFLTATHVSFGSIRDTFVHLLSVERCWLARARKQVPPPDLAPVTFPDMPTITAQWHEIDAATHRFVDHLSADDLAQIIRYTNAQGEPNAYPLWQILFHQANPAAQHRSEIALLLTGMGYSTGWLDYLIYVDLRAAAQEGVTPK
jgi:uncharacterized damage-inducible protein DinB